MRTNTNKHTFHSLHAEMSALLNAKKNVDVYGSSIYVVRIMSNNSSLGNSKPCCNCEYNLYLNGIKKIYYTDVVNAITVLVEMKIM